MKITFIRHAESEYNKKKIFQGRADIKLSEEGMQKTIEKSKTFNENEYDLCICSPLIRTRQTADILLPNIEKIYDDRLVERDLGDYQDTKITEEKIYLLNNTDLVLNAETKAEMTDRALDCIKDIISNYSDRKVIVITHAGIIYCLTSKLTNESCFVDNLTEVVIDVEKEKIKTI